MRESVVIALVVGAAIVVATSLWIYFSPYQSCVRAYEAQIAARDEAEKVADAAAAAREAQEPPAQPANVPDDKSSLPDFSELSMGMQAVELTDEEIAASKVLAEAKWRAEAAAKCK